MNDNLVETDKYENYLLVEGSDDKHVLHHLLSYHQILQQLKTKNEHIEIKDHQGIDNLLSEKALRTYLKIDELRRFGIIVDADTDLATRWESLRNNLISLGYITIPKHPDLDGTIVEQEGLPVVGLWLMPNNKVPGMLEDFISFLVPPGDLLWPMADTILQQVIAIDRRFPEIHTIKAHVHTWLAWQVEPGKPMGQAITKRYLDATAPHAQQLIRWIRRLFDLEATS